MELDLPPLRKEFHVFWQSVTLREGYIMDSAAVCVAELDRGSTMVTRIFHGGREPVAADSLADWLENDASVQAASDVSLQIFVNYSPLADTSSRLAATSSRLAALLTNMAEAKKGARLSLKFAALRGVFAGESDDVRNQDGLRKLRDAGAKVDVMFEEDWSLLTSLLADKASQRKIRRVAGKDKRHLRWILRGGDAGNDVTAFEDMAEVEESGASEPGPPTRDKFLE